MLDVASSIKTSLGPSLYIRGRRTTYWPTICFLDSSWAKNVIYIFKSLKTNQKKNILGHKKITWNLISGLINEVSLQRNHTTHCSGALYCQGRTVVTETTWSMGPKIITMRPLTGTVPQALTCMTTVPLTQYVDFLPKSRSSLCCSRNGRLSGRLMNVSGTSFGASARGLWVRRRTRQCCCCSAGGRGRTRYPGSRSARSRDRTVTSAERLWLWCHRLSTPTSFFPSSCFQHYDHPQVCPESHR